MPNRCRCAPVSTTLSPAARSLVRKVTKTSESEPTMENDSVGGMPDGATGNDGGAGGATTGATGNDNSASPGGATGKDGGVEEAPVGETEDDNNTGASLGDDRESVDSAITHRAKIILVGGDDSTGGTGSFKVELLSDGCTMDVPPKVAMDVVRDGGPLRAGEEVSVTFLPGTDEVNGIIRD